MNRLKSGLATGGLLALALAITPAIPAGAAAAAAGSGTSSPANESASLKATEQSRAAASASALGLASGEQLTVRTVIKDADGSTHVRYERTLNGLRVIGGDFITHKDASGTVRSVTWNLRKDVTPATMTPTVSRATAQRAALAASKANGEKASAGELVVYQGAKAPVLAYEVVTEGVTSDQTPSRLHTIVDATTGATLTSWDDIKEGTGTGIFVGNVSLATSGSSGSYTMRDTHGNYATDLNQATSGTGTTFTDADDVWGNGLQSNRQSAAVDAHYGAGKTYDYYNTQLGRAGIWNNGTGARSRVHYGQNYVNAFWDGTQMTYGDGANNAAPLVELDVAGHEMSHGVTENTANLTYSGESGGLNESTSDIFGTAVEWYTNNPNDVPDYLIGEEINLNGNGTPLRYMDKPSKDGSSKDCWSSTLGSLDPHYSSGPLNHWYYLASEGSGAKTINGVSYNSPTCNGATVTGISHLKVEKIWYRTLSTYLTSSSNYAAARTGVIKAAKDLYGAGSAECTAVDNAMAAISAPASTETCGGTTPPPGSGVVNGGFESGQTGWTGTSGPITNNTGRPAHSGSWKLWLGGNGTTASEYEQQTITVPSTATSPTLTYWLRLDTSETTTTTAYDKATVSLNGTTVKSYSNLSTPKASYFQVSVDLTAYKGTSVTVKFAATEDSSLQTSFVFDDVATNF
ncbi:peptidase [Intrasporangium oryzae NRRL B-24470]|uniref:Neutral metalloproteinase n=1 Tax=Intrasporangium oryzae NRRL B-24470 TaxID=1386089 RepID=W9G1A1_9MICO|nr:M4 family metallopeptidase [Intrasporangium oryzae]EWS99719.1 peptidase [Intrasporangium oryzae NRRL B-24470]